jgi:deoxycytidine triphosphate deaminase
MKDAGILGKQTLKDLLENNSLVIEKGENTLSFTDLENGKLIDETSINLNIGKLFRFDSKIAADIKGTYKIDDNFKELLPDNEGGIVIEPNDFLVGITYEKISMPENIVGYLSARRSVAGNLGIEIDGYIPPGLTLQHITFNLKNNTNIRIKVYVADIPPMKTTFQSLSSNEVYGLNRQVQIDNEQTILNSGLGSSDKKDFGEITYSFLFDAFAIQGKKHVLRLTIHNETTTVINKITVVPSLSPDDYFFSSLSNDWEFVHDDTKVCSVCKTNECNHKICYNLPIKSEVKKEFEFKIVFKEPKKSTKFKIDLTANPDNENIQIVDKSESYALQVQNKTHYLLLEFGDRFLDALIIAIFIFVIEMVLHSINENYGKYIVSFIIGVIAYLLLRYKKKITERFGK